ncbi:FAD binding domain protein [Talaromyces stipitatus ATCC 10500]|uniref:FAD binding domain protein n=1 Tax=Talaromyces stipitatus (strain ATCC 10500 / CBS 375.48 / QM 6759 / NRRL 1006) TaxID=441959 RepID=B8MM87_TALSN|nr:FAD binding domain protein [Talaromyces stipitatus ATCC 10500]EED13599.1 FAD binding domain protein [Talaromyces stipitatus ATCC 10500]
MATETSSPILIVGAGISGLSLAQYLRKSGIPFRIFDRDASIVSRTGGWGLTFHWGLPALKELLPDELYERLRECNVNPNAQDAGKYRFLDLKTGESLHAATFPKTGRLRVIRSKLRTLLATGIDIEWSKKCVDISDNQDGVSISFEDGTTANGWLLVASDGANSRIRQCLHPSAFENNPVPVRLLGVTVSYTPEEVASALAIDPYFFQGTHSDSNIYLFFSFLNSPYNTGNDTGNYICQVIISWAESKSITTPESNQERIALIKRITSDWEPHLRSLIEIIPDDAEATTIHLADWFPTTNREHERVILMGDAAHTMTMFRGEGGNNATTDAYDFVKRIGPLIEEKNQHREVPWEKFKQALDEYDRDVLTRGRLCVINARQACLDAHDFSLVTEDSPLVSRRGK